MIIKMEDGGGSLELMNKYDQYDIVALFILVYLLLIKVGYH